MRIEQHKQERQTFENINDLLFGGRHGRDRMVVGFTTTCAISAYYL
jgi:hypothetical protein